MTQTVDEHRPGFDTTGPSPRVAGRGPDRGRRTGAAHDDAAVDTSTGQGRDAELRRAAAASSAQPVRRRTDRVAVCAGAAGRTRLGASGS